MKNLFDYIAYRTFEYFNKKGDSIAVTKTINFLVVFQASLLVPIFMIINLFIKINPQVFGVDNKIKYYIGIPLAVFLIALNSLLYRKKLKGEKLKEMERKFQREKYKLPIGIIFFIPVVFVFILPILLGVVNGTIHFPFLEK